MIRKVKGFFCVYRFVCMDVHAAVAETVLPINIK